MMEGRSLMTQLPMAWPKLLHDDLGWLNSNNHNRVPLYMDVLQTRKYFPVDTHWLQCHKGIDFSVTTKYCRDIKDSHSPLAFNDCRLVLHSIRGRLQSVTYKNYIFQKPGGQKRKRENWEREDEEKIFQKTFSYLVSLTSGQWNMHCHQQAHSYLTGLFVHASEWWLAHWCTYVDRCKADRRAIRPFQ